MSDNAIQTVNARGMMCPRPIIELAKLSRRLPNDTVALITADDLAFESDVRARCETTGHRLVELTREGEVVSATIRFCKATVAP